MVVTMDSQSQSLLSWMMRRRLVYENGKTEVQLVAILIELDDASTRMDTLGKGLNAEVAILIELDDASTLRGKPSPCRRASRGRNPY